MTTVSKQKKVKYVRQKLKLFRANEPLKSVIMWGIDHSYTALSHMKPPAMLLGDDFKAYMKVKITHHMFNKENMPSRFKFKDYFPMVFNALREKFKVNKLDYWDSFTRFEPLWDRTRGKSGSRFLVTTNRQFVAKTISSEEVVQMHQIIEDYYAYVVRRNGKTLLPQYLGLYRLTVNTQETYILVMRNVFSPRLVIHKKYDLKGSVIEREANEKEKSKPLPTLKDNDFLNDACKLYIGEQAKEDLLEVLTADIQFLQLNNLIDYSLLIGVHEVDQTTKLPISDSTNPQAQQSNQDVVSGSPPGFTSPTTPASPNTTELPGSPNPVFIDETLASSGDGQGSLLSHWQQQMNTGALDPRYSISTGPLGTSTSTPGGIVVLGSGGDDDDVAELDDATPDQLADQSVIAAASGSPSDSPVASRKADVPFVGQLHPQYESYALNSSPASPRRQIYFVAIIDTLTRYGVRKRTAQTYKSVKHGPGAETRPDIYGRRLIEFITQCVE